jgi:transcriptional regulator with XRE-family HTH domain
VRDALRRYVEERHDGNATKAADALGITQSAISQILSRKNRASFHTARALAFAIDVDPADVMRGELPRVVTSDDPYPERDEALRRLKGLLPSEVDEKVRSVIVAGQRFSVDDWINVALERKREHQRRLDLEARIGPDRRSGT